MARKPRLHVPGGFYDVMLRGSGGQDIFFAKADRQRFLELLAEGVGRFGRDASQDRPGSGLRRTADGAQ